MELAVLVCIHALFVLSLWFPLYTGVINLGLSGFLLTGGVVAGALSASGVPAVLSIGAGTLAGGLLGVGPALLALRVNGLYLAIATLAFAELVTVIVRNTNVLGGVQGVTGAVPISGMVIVGVTALLFVLAVYLFLSPFGRALESAGGDEIAASSSGVPVNLLRTVMIFVGALTGGLAGALYVHYYGYVAPSSFGFGTVVESMIFLIVGGLTPLGALAGAAVFTMLPQWFSGLGGWVELVYAGAAMVVLVFLPRGVLSKTAFLKGNALFRRVMNRRAANVDS